MAKYPWENDPVADDSSSTAQRFPWENDPVANPNTFKDASLPEAARQSGVGLATGLGVSVGRIGEWVGEAAQAPIATAKEYGLGLASFLHGKEGEWRRSGTFPTGDMTQWADTNAVVKGAAQQASAEATAARKANIAGDGALGGVGALGAQAGQSLERAGQQYAKDAAAYRDIEAPIISQQMKNTNAAEGFGGTLKAAVIDNPLGTAFGILPESGADLVLGMGAGKVVGTARSAAVAGRAGKAIDGVADAVKAGTLPAAEGAAQIAAIKEAAQKSATNWAGEAAMLAEAASSAGSTRVGVKNKIEEMPLDALAKNSQRFRDLVSQGAAPEEARSIIAQELSAEVALPAGAMTYAGGKVIGDDVAMGKTLMGGPMTKKELAQRIGTEAGQEMIQSPGEDYAQYYAEKQVDPNAKFDLGKSIAMGLVSGTAMGGVMHGGGYALQSRDRAEAAAAKAAGVAPGATTTPDIEPAAPGSEREALDAAANTVAATSAYHNLEQMLQQEQGEAPKAAQAVASEQPPAQQFGGEPSIQRYDGWTTDRLMEMIQKDPENVALGLEVNDLLVARAERKAKADKAAATSRSLQGQKREETDATIDPVRGFVTEMRNTNTPAAQSFVRDYDAGRISDADIAQRIKQEQGRNGTNEADARIAAAAKGAKPDMAAPPAREDRTQSMIRDYMGKQANVAQRTQAQQLADNEAGQFSLARAELKDEIPAEQPRNRPLDRAELTTLRRTAARLENPKAGTFLRVTDDGVVIATGQKGTRIPDTFRKFANDNGLTFRAERKLPTPDRGNYTAGGNRGVSAKSESMPIAFRQDGALYFGEMGTDNLDRTGKTRFSSGQRQDVTDSASVLGLESEAGMQGAAPAAEDATTPDTVDASISKVLQGQFDTAAADGAAPAQVRAAVVVPGRFKTKVNKVEAAVVEALAGMFKRKVVWFDAKAYSKDAKGGDVVAPVLTGGYVRSKDDPNTIYLNANGNEGAVSVLMHEMGHMLERQFPKVYEALRSTVMASISEKRYAEIAKKYKSYGYSKDEVVFEMVADALGNAARSPDFWRKVFTRIALKHGKAEAKGIIAKLQNAVADMLAKAIDTLQGRPGFENFIDDIEAVNTALETATASFLEGVRMGADASYEGVENEGRGRKPGKPAAGVQFGEAQMSKKSSDNGHKRTKSGDYVGAPAGMTPGKLGALRLRLHKLTQEGTPGRFWYEESSDAILAAAEGDKALAEKIAGLLAIYSPQATVSANTSMGLKALYQWMNGEQIKVRFGHQDRKAQAWMDGTIAEEDALQIKTGAFFKNLMRKIDEARYGYEQQGATIDMWMARVFGYGSKAIGSSARYYFAERETKKIAAELGWEPQQVQAALWVSIKSRIEAIDAESREIGKKNGWLERKVTKSGGKENISWQPIDGESREKYEALKLKMALGLDDKVAADGIASSKYNFGTALRERIGQISWEAMPGKTTGVLPGIFNAPLEQQVEYLAAIDAALRDENGNDLIAAKLGLPVLQTAFGPSAWQMNVGAGAQTEVAVATDRDSKNKIVVNQNVKNLLNIYAAIRGYVLAQEAVVWHYPIFDAAKKNANGVQLDFGRDPTHDEVVELYNAMHEVSGREDWAPAYVPGVGVRVLNFAEPQYDKEKNDWSYWDAAGVEHRAATKEALLPLAKADGVDNTTFQGVVREAAKRIDAKVRFGTFQSDGDYIGNDWGDAPNGEQYKEIIDGYNRGVSRGSGRSDLQGWVESELRPRTERVNKEFAAKYGWGKTSFSTGRGYERSGNGRVDSVEGGSTSGEALRLGQTNVTGVHFSKEARARLSGVFFGRGAKSQEAERIAQSKDARIKSRIYAYVNEGSGVFPEDAVGGQAHKVQLDNLYDIEADPLDLSVKHRDLNAMESAILDAGFDGYYSKNAFHNQGVAILMGKAASNGIPAEHMGADYRGKELDVPAAGEKSTYGKLQRSVMKNNSLPGGEMTGADWKRMMPKLMPEIDVSHLIDDQKYYKDQIVERPKAAAQFSSARRAKEWAAVTNTPAGPVFEGDGFKVHAVREFKTETDFEEADGLPWGHSTYVEDKAYRFNLLDDKGNSIGFVDAEVNELDEITAIHDIAMKTPGNGTGTKIVAQMLANSYDGIRVIEALPQSKEFWSKFGASYDYRDNATISWEDYERSSEQGSKAQASFGRMPSARDKAQAGEDAQAEEVTAQFSTARLAPIFYSQLAKQVEAAPDRMFSTAPQFKAWLSSNAAKLGIKKDEIQWSGINEFLDTLGKGKVSKQQVLDYLEQGGVKVEEVVLGDVSNSEWWWRERIDGGNYAMHGPYNTEADARMMVEGKSEYVDGAWVDVDPDTAVIQKAKKGSNTKYGKYQLPGGENYRELLLTLPDGRKAANDAYDAIAAKARAESRTMTADEIAERNRLERQVKGEGQFKSSHWDEKNILAHIRYNDRTDADGKRVLFIEELQSDWGQKGKKEGFANEKLPSKPTSYADIVVGDRISGWGQVQSIRNGENGKEFDVGGLWITEGKFSIDKVESRDTSMHGDAVNQKGAPAAPFVTDTKAWVALALKRMMRYAADNGFEKIAFVNGEQSADRYDLSKQVSKLQWNKETGRLTFWKKGRHGEAAENKNVPEENLEDTLGKDVAKKLIEVAPNNDGNRVLSGLDLKVGGEGMKTFYDQIVPQVANDLLKKMGGGKVGTVEIAGTKKDAPIRVFAADVSDEIRKKVSAQDNTQQPGFPITDAIREKVAGGQALFSNPRFNPSTQPIWNSTEPTWWESVRRKYQDRFIDARDILKEIKAQVGQYADKWDGYLQEQLYHSRVASQVKDFNDLQLRPLMQLLVAAKADVKDFENFLWARHAVERNAQVAKVNPTMPDGGSGLTDKQAADVMAGKDVALKDGTVVQGVDQTKLNLYNQLAGRIDKMTSDTADILVAGGQEKASTVAAWRSTYKYYVPLQRDDEDGGMQGTGQGYSAKGGVKRALGSGRAVEEIIGNIAAARERAVKRSEKARVIMAFYGLAIQAPNPKFWAPIKPGMDAQKLQQELIAMGINPGNAQQMADKPKVRYVDPRSGLVVERPNEMFMNAPNVVALRVDGEDRFLVFNNDNARARELGLALKGLSTDHIEGFAKLVAPITRWMASVNTQYNPLFGITNIVRDTQGLLLNLSTTPIADKKAAVLKEIPGMLAGIYADLRSRRAGNGPTNSAASQLFEEFEREGGATGYMDMFSDAGSRTNKLLREAGVSRHDWKSVEKLDKLWQSAGGKKLVEDMIGGWLSDYNSTLENATRLAAYKAAKQSGMSIARSAELAKNITVNFNRKGQSGSAIGSMYAFFNAAVQGTQRLGETLAGPNGKKIIAGGIALGALQALALAAAGFDGDEPPEFVRERNIIIPIGDKKYLTIPMPLGFHVLHNLGRAPVEAVMYPRLAGEKLSGLLATTFNAFNPIGSGTLAQTLSPTASDPIVALSENKNWQGQAITRESFDKTKPGHLLAKDTATGISKWLSEGINAMTGGTDYQRGMFSPSPDAIDYLAAQAGGGVWREGSKLSQAIGAAGSGEELPAHKIPLAGKFYGNTEGQAPRANRYYRILDEMRNHEAEIKGRQKDGKPTEDYFRKNPDASMWSMADKSEKRVQFLRRNKRKAIEAGDKERVKSLEEQISSEMLRFTEQVEARRER